MYVIVIGAGEVGSSIADSLADSHDVVVVESDGERAESLAYSLDVMVVEGDGTSADVLREAGIDRADMLIASTDRDEANIVACTTAKTIADPFTIARVRKADYLRTWQNSEGAFGIDLMVSVDLLTAHTIVRIAGMPGAQDVDTFSEGRVRMAQFEIVERSPLADRTVAESDRYDRLTFAAVMRDGEPVVATGDTVIQPGDRLIVIGTPDSLREFATTIAFTEALGSNAEIVVVGGSEIGFQTARLFEEQGFEPRLIEADPERARDLAEDLPGTIVMEHDATDRDFLEREYVGDADVFVAALGSDERNMLAALLAKRLGATRTVAVVENAEFVELFEAIGVDAAVNPRAVTAEEITRFTLEGQAENVALIENDRAEVVEIELDADSPLVGRPISESVDDLPSGVVIGAITRGEEFITPRGDTTLEAEDHVIFFADADVVDEVTATV